MGYDQRRLKNQLQRLIKNEPNSQDSQLTSIIQAVEQSYFKREQRQNNRPTPIFPLGLPITDRKADIKTAIEQHQVTIICGETGSGKTTQLPKICLELNRGISGIIGHTQPRRIAARSVAARIAEELASPLGALVGYKIRFQDRFNPTAYIKLMTDGILLAETQKDPNLNYYDTLIIDEAHERSLNIDFLLGYLKQILPKRPDLKVIITSATIDTKKFSDHFSQAPIIEVSGRSYPVEIRYCPLDREAEDKEDQDIQQGILAGIKECTKIGLGDILVFLPGEREIHETTTFLKKHPTLHSDVLPLYGRLSNTAQNQIFNPIQGKRRIILATNVAETSLTVPGIHYVIDTGLARISRYSTRNKVQQLPIEKISQSSANQRAGRCGRITAGVCIRLYSEMDFQNRPEFTDPEILRTNLGSVILQMKGLKLGDPEDFPFIDPPPTKMINDGLRLLLEIGAIDKSQNLTKVGKQLICLPVDPKIGRIVIAGGVFHCLKEILIIASGLSIQDPRERPLEQQQAVDIAHARFLHEQSDFLSYLNIWEEFQHQKSQLSQNKLRTYCHNHFLSYLRLKEWQDTHHQLQDLATQIGFSINQIPAEYNIIHQALLAGLLTNIAFKTEKEEYLGTRNSKLHIFPGSGQFKKALKWIMAAELVETTKLYARCVAKIDPQWVEPLASHLLKHSYFNPHWEKNPAQVMVDEQVTLYGLVIVPKRRVHYGPINAKHSREIFIREALINSEYKTSSSFFNHNQELINNIENLEHKNRRQDILVDEEVLYQFYDQHIPADVYSGTRFEHWYQQASKDNVNLLYLTEEMLIRRDVDEIIQDKFPDKITIQGIPFALSYRFDPSHSEDGVMAVVPIAVLNQLNNEPFQWLVPGLLKEKIIFLIKSLPKNLRRCFVPVPDFAESCCQSLSFREGNFLEVLANQLRKKAGINITEKIWEDINFPPHLLMGFQLIDEKNQILATGRDLDALQKKWGHKAQIHFEKVNIYPDQEKITQWDFGDLPEHIEFEQQGLPLLAYPALQDQGNSASLIVKDSKEEAEEITSVGLRRLFILTLGSQIKTLRKNLPKIQKTCLYYTHIPLSPWRDEHSFSQCSCEELKDEMVKVIIDRTFLTNRPLIRNEKEFVLRQDQHKSDLFSTANKFCHLIAEILNQYHLIIKTINSSSPIGWLVSINDIKEQLTYLIYHGFISETPPNYLGYFPRYLEAIKLRYTKLHQDPQRDQQRCKEILSLWEAYLKRWKIQYKEGKIRPELTTYRWMLEEYRVSLFAQELGTSCSISSKRLKSLWEKI
ncbi:hypothetical protein NURINAE_00559 [Candidatus Nitrosacidococcus sp. I8]|nr:hypothetical protein NURINAE_00559 [Candidatus Nitrosacidococcus sp. I8]